MSPLDINQSEKAIRKLVTPAGKQHGGNAAQPLTCSTAFTDNLEPSEFLLQAYYIPVDGYLRDISCSYEAHVNLNNDHSDSSIANNRTKPPTNAGCTANVGISLISTRDAVWNGTAGMTPMLPAQKMSRDSQGNAMIWSGDLAISALPPTLLYEVPTQSRGYLEKASRQSLFFDNMTEGKTSKTLHMDKINWGRRKGKKDGFNVKAGEKICFWMRNITGTSDNDLKVNIQASMVPKVRYFPLEDIIQDYTYRDEAHQRWGTTTATTYSMEDGDGSYGSWKTVRVVAGIQD